MRYINTKRVIGLVLMLAVAGATFASNAVARASFNHPPELPSPLCDSIQVPEGNKLSRHVYARGVQIYKWNGAAWVFVAPMATLYASPRFRGPIGTHYAGPTWESNSGSQVVAARVPNTGCSPDPTAVPWLLLQAVSTEGPGIFGCVSYIQRVNTTGGLAPTEPGTSIDETVEVPYTAEYFFYREQH
jgi:hypothetical protein